MLGQEAVEQERSLTFEVRLCGYRSLSLDETNISKLHA